MTIASSLYWESAGSGEPVVLLHGFSLDTRMWDDQVETLATRYRVIRYDLRGFGRSAPSPDAYTHAGDLKALLDRLGIDRAALMGLSLGGGAAINFAIQFPDRVRALIVVSTLLGGVSLSPGFVAAQAAIRSAARDEGIDAAREQWLSLPIFTRTLANPACADRVRRIVGDYSGWHWLNRDPGQPLVPPAVQRLDAIRCPTLVVVGELDTPDFQAIADTLAETIAGVEKEVIPAAGHLPNLEMPRLFNETVLTFLSHVDQKIQL